MEGEIRGMGFVNRGPQCNHPPTRQGDGYPEQMDIDSLLENMTLLLA